MDLHELALPFAARGIDGVVNIDVRTNDEPGRVGSAEWARGFPMCEARIDWPATGYNALLGWVQVVGMQSPDSKDQRHWVADPLEIYDGLNTPFGFYGISPTLFDAPARSDLTRPLDWYAESFLCFAPTRPMAREVHPVAGFSWGFVLRNEQITMIEPRQLDLRAWDRHVDLLRVTSPGWEFAGQA